MAVTLVRISGDEPTDRAASDIPIEPAADAFQALLEVLKQLEPLGQNLANPDGTVPSWILRTDYTDRETVLQLETGDDAHCKISYWFDSAEAERLCQAIEALDKVAVSNGPASYRLSIAKHSPTLA